MDGIKSAMENITSAFRVPLEAKGVNLSSLHDEIEEVVDHARRYLSIDKVCYQKVWYKLHTSPDSSKWPNILLICQLLFSLPFSSGRVERIFSTLKVIKTDKQDSTHPVFVIFSISVLKAQDSVISLRIERLNYGGRIVPLQGG